MKPFSPSNWVTREHNNASIRILFSLSLCSLRQTPPLSLSLDVHKGFNPAIFFHLNINVRCKCILLQVLRLAVSFKNNIIRLFNAETAALLSPSTSFCASHQRADDLGSESSRRPMPDLLPLVTQIIPDVWSKLFLPFGKLRTYRTSAA